MMSMLADYPLQLTQRHHGLQGKKGGGARGDCHFVQILGCWKICQNFVQKFASRNSTFEAGKLFILRKFSLGKIENLSTHNFLCQKFAAVCWISVGNLLRLSKKLQLPGPPTFSPQCH